MIERNENRFNFDHCESFFNSAVGLKVGIFGIVAMARLAPCCLLLALAAMILQSGNVFITNTAPRFEKTIATTAGASAAIGLAGPASAFVYDGKEYFDIWFGIDPLYWGITAFCVVSYGAVLKNAALKYNKPYGTQTLENPQPLKTSGFVGQLEESGGPGWKA